MRDEVKDYYGRQLQCSGDLKTSSCCDAGQMPDWLKPLLARVHPEVSSRYYGCGLVAPTSSKAAGGWIWAAVRVATVTCWRR